MSTPQVLLAHAGHWTTWLLYGIPAIAIGAALWSAARNTRPTDEEKWRDDPRLSDDA